MDYREVKDQLEETKLKLMKKAKNPNLSPEEQENIQNSIINFEYIIELTDMNHFERGFESNK
ncbi:DUF3896 family protein [Neobacillus mesonae]|uniref:DUF3896 family protein n=1 Tax=Neobacillus mesonae TaxID=1193713 RepID=UPI002E1EF087|nr:DUF3896 family protein [Neobacillus mesonae]